MEPVPEKLALDAITHSLLRMTSTIAEAREYVLTIGIPTWNRCGNLAENLAALVREVIAVAPHAVEIYISDNASTDDTRMVGLDYAARYPFVTYHRNERNIGANANFQRVLESARGRYVWLFGDDDLIVEGSLSNLVDDIRRYDFPSVVIGGCIFDDTRERAYLRAVHEAVLTDAGVFAVHDAIELSGKITVLVFQREAVGRVLAAARPLIEGLRTGWPHLIWTMLLLGNGGTLLILPYATNYYVTRNRHNLIYDGVTLAELHINDYSRCVGAISPLVPANVACDLIRSLTRGRHSQFLKLVVYATYLNGYAEELRYAWSTLKLLPTWYNKRNFLLYYALPSLLPRSVRKGICTSISAVFFRWQRYRQFIEHVQGLKQHLRPHTDAGKARAFSRKDL